MPQKNTNRLMGIARVILAFSIVISVIWAIGFVLRKISFDPQSRVEIKHFYTRLQLGQTKSKVQSVFRSGNYQKLKLNGTSTRVSTPLEVGEGNWVLYIGYNAQNRVSSLKIRTIDSIYERPREPAPADKIAP